ncbi:MAG: UvrD-helicase domain-containing protein [Candidatus Omnitrophica bacterium]|nr:UvrD-helicase domain-containing protein [Candidatus Omnitrophota bacterium]
MNQLNTSNLTFPEVKIVEASAGSGKTYELAKRFIQLLMNPRLKADQIPLRSILAITFTLKATREMRERILEQLKKIALNAFSNPQEKRDFLNAVGLSEETAGKEAFAIIDYIIYHYNFFQVKNIDKFINVILSGCASELKLSANFRIKEDYSSYVSYALDKCIDQAADDEVIKDIFENFLNQYLFLENRTGWFPKNNVLEILRDMFQKVNIYGGRFEKFPVQSKELIILKQKILEILHQINNANPEGMNKTFLNRTLRNFISNNTRGFNIADLDKKAFLSDTLPMNKGYNATPEIVGLWSDFRKYIIDLSEKEALSLFNCYIDIFERVYDIFREYAQKEDVVFMEELNKQSSILFEESELSVPELYYRLASRFRHYLIDEFQDTNKLQWNNLFLMIEDALSSGGSLFYVGDKKQAIYRFRGGDVKLFDDIKTDFNQFNINDKTSLRTNYRSQKEIVQFNNQIFSMSNLKLFLGAQQEKAKDALRTLTQEQIQEILNVFSGSKQSEGPNKLNGYVKVENIEYEDKEEGEELIRLRLIDTMRSLIERFPLKSIAILCRSNKEIELVTGWLSSEKINVESERTLNIMNNPLIQEIIAFLKFLNSPIDDIAFSAFILGDIFTTAALMERQKVSDFIFEFNRKEAKTTGYLYRAFRKQFPDIWDEFMANFFKSVGFVSLYELLVSIFYKFSVFKNFGNLQGFFMHLLELSMKLEEENSDITFFLESIDTIGEKHFYVNFSDQNAVKVMTIHKAKGLGFPVVLVPFLDMNINGTRSNRSKAPYVVYEKQPKGKFGLLRLDSKYAKFSPHIRDIYRREYVRAFIDELNVIYVTFTRAECELYIFVSSNAKKDNNPALLLIPVGITEMGKQIKYSENDTGHEFRQLHISMPQYKDWVSALKEEFPQGSEIINRKSIKRGEMLHVILGQVNNLNDQKPSECLKIIRAVMNNRYPGVEGAEGYIAKVEEIISSKNTKRFFFCDSKAKIYKEKEFVDKYGRTFRIDRLVIRDNEALVLDFKSSQEGKEDHVKQVREYMHIVQDVYPEKNVQGYLLYMDQVKVVEI